MKQSYKELVQQYAPTLDLFGPAVLREWETHEQTARRYADQLPASVELLDVGSGGGLPGIVIAQQRPDLRVTLCERRRRRAAFLQLAARQLQLGNVTVFPRDARDFPGPVSWVSAQAVADLPALLQLVRQAVTPRWNLLTRRPNAWYPPDTLMGFRIQARRETLDQHHDLFTLSFSPEDQA